MSLKLNSSGGGSVTLQEPVTASTLTLNLPAFSGTAATLATVTNNGVLYVNSSGQPTSGSALTFNGTLLEVAAASAAPVGKFSHTGDVPGGAVVIGDPTTAASITSLYLRSTTKANINFAAGSALAFNGAGDGSSERARIDSSGNLFVGATTSAGAFSVNSYARGWYLSTNHQTGINGDSYSDFLYAGTKIGSVAQNGTTGVLYNTSSDYRLKNITGPITTSGAYIDSLNPVEGTWKADGSTFVGLIAHEVQEASRTPVATGTKDGEQMQGMDYSSSEIIANLIAEVKSLRQRLAAAGI